jgi:hypothetical protein
MEQDSQYSAISEMFASYKGQRAAIEAKGGFVVQEQNVINQGADLLLMAHKLWLAVTAEKDSTIDSTSFDNLLDIISELFMGFGED